MPQDANREMLILAREIRGMTQKQLADKSGIDQGRISRYEGGMREVPDSELGILAEALSFPISFFTSAGNRLPPETSEIFHRKHSTVAATQEKPINALMNIYRLGIEKLLTHVETKSTFSIPEGGFDKFGRNIEQIAAIVRATWRIPSGPIDNVIARLEAASCFVFRLDFGTDKMDELVQWIKPLPPIILVNTQLPGERIRFSLAHALGHLVMHRDEVPYPEMEAEADSFASAFLMPADDIRLELAPVTIEHMLQLKPYWKVSMQALIRRAKDIGEINERRYTSLFQMLSRNGYRKNEPNSIPIEQPTQFVKLLRIYFEGLKYDINDIATLTDLLPEDFQNWFYPESLKTDKITPFPSSAQKRSS